jgi:hypothetical protein
MEFRDTLWEHFARVLVGVAFSLGLDKFLFFVVITKRTLALG